MLPPNLQSRVHTEEFWRWFLFVDEESDPSGDPWEVRFPLGVERRSLRLAADTSGGVTLSLNLSTATLEIAWDDLAHWHPHVLRWPELHAICRRVEAQAPAAVDPGLTLLLLARFAPIVTADDAQLALPLLEDAWNRLGIESPESRSRLLAITDFRNAGVRWRRQDGVGWSLEQNENAGPPILYSLRIAGNREFPWQEWHALMNEISGDL